MMLPLLFRVPEMERESIKMTSTVLTVQCPDFRTQDNNSKCMLERLRFNMTPTVLTVPISGRRTNKYN